MFPHVHEIIGKLLHGKMSSSKETKEVLDLLNALYQKTEAESALLCAEQKVNVAWNKIKERNLF